MDKISQEIVDANSIKTPAEAVVGFVFLVLFIVIGAIICHLLGIEPSTETCRSMRSHLLIHEPAHDLPQR